MKIYEVLVSYTAFETYHVKANNEDEALKQYNGSESRHFKTNDGSDDLVEVADEWKLADYTKKYGEFK